MVAVCALQADDGDACHRAVRTLYLQHVLGRQLLPIVTTCPTHGTIHPHHVRPLEARLAR